MKNAIILAAQELGFFRAKSLEKREKIAQELQGTELAQGFDVLEVLEAETAHREHVRKTRAAARLTKQAKEMEKPVSGGVDSPTAHVETLPRGVYVVTSAQNNTDVDVTAWACIKNIAEYYGAKIIVCPFTYNKSGFQQGQDCEGLWYAPELVTYMESRHINIGSADIIGTANVLPTAKNPLSSFAGATASGIDVIVPAAKIALQCTAALKGSRGKILASTGAVTKINYILRKAGTVAAHEHNIGALLVDTTGESTIIRQLELMPGSDYISDKGMEFYANGETRECVPLALQFGDIHAEKMTGNNLLSCLELIEAYNPDNIILHDVCDFSSRNHHNIKDNTFIFQQYCRGNTVEQDLQKVGEIIATISGESTAKTHIIESNHDLAIETWLKNADFKQDPINAEIYLKLTLEMYRTIREFGSPANMLEYALKGILGYDLPDVIFHETDSSVKLGDALGIEHGCHGDKGANGARGTPQGFRALGVPLNTGHTHTPAICGKVYTAGVAGALDMGYNVGPSSWQIASIVTYANGQRQIIFH